MKPEKLKYFEERLLSLQAEQLGVSELIELCDQSVQLDQANVGRLSRMDALQQQMMSQATDMCRQVSLVAIKEALERIEDNTYGECLGCLDNIPEARLDGDPASAYCIQCADKKE